MERFFSYHLFATGLVLLVFGATTLACQGLYGDLDDVDRPDQSEADAGDADASTECDPDQCPAGYNACDDGKCVECTEAGDCPDDPHCDDNECVECIGPDGCETDETCRDGICTDECTSDEDCNDEICNEEAAACVECLEDDDCGDDDDVKCCDNSCIDTAENDDHCGACDRHCGHDECCTEAPELDEDYWCWDETVIDQDC